MIIVVFVGIVILLILAVILIVTSCYCVEYC